MRGAFIISAVAVAGFVFLVWLFNHWLIALFNDAIKIVRCKDCCHRVHDEERGLYYCEKYYGQGDVSDENFCQWGERREE